MRLDIDQDIYLLRYDGPLADLNFAPSEVEDVKSVPMGQLRDIFAAQVRSRGCKAFNAETQQCVHQVLLHCPVSRIFVFSAPSNCLVSYCATVFVA